MDKLTDYEEKIFLGWLKTKQLRGKQIAEVWRASGRFKFASLLASSYTIQTKGLPAGLSKERANIQAAELNADALKRLAHYTRSARFSLKHLIKLHRLLREIK